MIKSLITYDNIYNTTKQLEEWIRNRNKEVSVKIQQVPLSKLNGWCFDSDGNLRHQSCKFFSIEGISVDTDYGYKTHWEQPIINQPEIGYLGILTKEIDGVLYFLMQAKIEPGNVNNVQISPTLQATKSNYTGVHKGKRPLYLDYFINAKPGQILVDQLQSEQGARFLRKRNRNIIIKVEDDIEVLEDYRWFTLAQIKHFIHFDNMVNMDTRTVISGINYAEFAPSGIEISKMSNFGMDMILSVKSKDGFHSMENVLSWLTNQKSRYDLVVKYKPLKDIAEWTVDENEIYNNEKKFFKVIGVDVSIANREVATWMQPIVQPTQSGLCAFLIKKINGVYHFLIQSKLECGNFDVMELAPTVQCLTGNVYTSTTKPAFVDFILENKGTVLYDTYQSEEGGRFYHEQNRNMLIEVGEDFPIDVPENYCWMTLGQIFEFLRFNNFLNIQARSLISSIKFV